jgi:Mg-chelatase subunit ChlD
MEASMSKTLVTFLLDRTGSMETVRDDTIGAYNTFLETLQQNGDSIYFTLIQFDSMGVDKLYVNAPVNNVPRLTRETFVPRASTPLIDAAYKTIKAVEKAVSGNPSNKVVICIQTDGQENSSTEHTWDQLNALIKEKFEAGWQFNFMGAGIDAYQQASRMGIAADQTLAYAKDAESSRAAFRATAENTALYSRGRAASTAYSKRQKHAAADKYDPDPNGSQPKERSQIVDDITL